MNTAGSTANCIALGNPPPTVQWLDKENNPITSISKVITKVLLWINNDFWIEPCYLHLPLYIFQIRHILANNSLHFPQFSAEEFRQDAHWSIYRCTASNSVGTIVSRDIVVKAGREEERKLHTGYKSINTRN